jgi:hypothetical protein
MLRRMGSRARMASALGGGAGKPPVYSFGEIGDTLPTTVEVAFSQPVTAAGNDYSTGVTITVGGAGVAIASGTRQTNENIVFYVIPAVAINGIVTWAYSTATGVITSSKGVDLANVAAQTITNYIGSQLYFNDFNASGHLATIGV